MADSPDKLVEMRALDPEDFAQKERLRQIYDARQAYQDRRSDLDQIRREEELELYEIQDYLLAAFKRYFYEVEGLMERHPAGEMYLEEVELGLVENAKPGGEDRVFIGLSSLTQSYKPMPTSGYTTRLRGRNMKETKVYVTVPVFVTDLGFREVNKFLAEVGLDADMQEETEDAGFDYSDLLEDGPPEGEAPQITADGNGNVGEDDE